MFECDGIGCGFTGALEEVEAHVLDAAEVVNWNPSKIVCWGAMEVGGLAWQEFHAGGRHPMQTLMEGIIGIVDDNPEYWELFEGGRQG